VTSDGTCERGCSSESPMREAVEYETFCEGWSGGYTSGVLLTKSRWVEGMGEPWFGCARVGGSRDG
jgi:hypothetical protein